MVVERYKHVGAIEVRLVEECSEVIKEVCKIQRFGYTADNQYRLHSELADVMLVVLEMQEKLRHVASSQPEGEETQ